jgi:tRNA threonylcarbamoyladenosine biosynthesis protein TsaE
MRKIVITKSAKETKKIASRFARQILRCPKLSLGQGAAAAVIALTGNLGSGKTVFIQGFAKGLSIKENITSSTFVLMRVYALHVMRYARLIHIDAYRIEKPKELIDLGFKNLLCDSKNIILIEWAERIKGILPKDCVIINFEHINKNTRRISIKSEARNPNPIFNNQ